MLRSSARKYTPSKNNQSIQLNFDHLELSNEWADQKKSKYDSYTPRKKYIKEAENSQFSNFTFNQEPQSNRVKYQEHQLWSFNQTPLSRQKKFSDLKKQLYQSDKQNLLKSMNEKIQKRNDTSPLKEINFFRETNNHHPNRNKYKNLDPPLFNEKKLKFVDLEKSQQFPLDRSYQTDKLHHSAQFNYLEKQSHNRKSIIKIREENCKEIEITPRKQNLLKESISYDLIEKSQIIKNKLEKLRKMTPCRKSVTPQKLKKKQSMEVDRQFILVNQSIEYEDYSRDYKNYEEQPIPVSSRASEKQNEIMSKSKLQRLEQKREQYIENDIDVIQDLSHRINSKLQSIIRNYS